MQPMWLMLLLTITLLFEDFPSKTAIPSIPSHSTKLAVTSTCEWVSWNSRRMGQVEIGSQVLHESMLPECVTDGTNSIMHITLDVMRLIDADVWLWNSNCDVPWQGGGSVASGARWWWATAECTSPSWIASRPMTALVASWVSLDWECSPSCLLDHSLPLLRCPPIPASRLFAPCSWLPRSTFFSIVCSLRTENKGRKEGRNRTVVAVFPT